MWKHRGLIGEPIDDSEPAELSPKNKGNFREISFAQALNFAGEGYSLFSDRLGSYILARQPPNALYDPVQSCPSGMCFKYNRVQKRLVVSRMGKVMSSLQCDR